MKNYTKKYRAQTSNVTLELGQAQKPIYWKQVLVTTFTVYPLILAASWFLNLLFPMKALKPEVAIFFSVVTVASLMVFPVMPFITKYMGSWMRKKQIF